jgi:uncharacterized protein YciI
MSEYRGPGYGIEQVWVVEATYAPDAAESRPAVRDAHLAHIAELMAAGTVIEVGGYLDLSRAILIVRADSEAEAIAVFRDDIYMRAGVWVELRAKAFGRFVLIDEG